MINNNIHFFQDCLLNMAAVPHGAFAAKKVRKNEERRKEFHCKFIECLILNKIGTYNYA